MDIQLKQRVIGVIVFFTLLIIFLPMVFEFDTNEQKLDQLLIPIQSDSLAVSDKNQSMNSKTVDIITESQVASKLDTKSHISAQSETDPNQIEQEILAATKLVEDLQKKILVKSSEKPVDNSPDTVLNKKSEETAEASIVSLNKQAMELNNQENIKENIKENTKNNTKIKKVIRYNISAGLASTDIYAIKINNAKNREGADKIKDLLLSMGFPAYTSKVSNDNAVYIGPDLELKYIKEMANRVLDETDYQPEIIAHNKNWLANN